MNQSNANNTVQAVPLVKGKMKKGPGKYKTNTLIHCENDGEILVHGDFPYAMTVGMDRAYSGYFTIVSGSFTFD